ncbi:hypothetical protein ANCCEY_00557 [Ancylostoma ceylanicum]|uniref:HTH psq-type domain-containing protein n=1 Tax=Ancylostoma ceylanicum TaxID=53326 RepID=A0A0D6M881_9BILA|nr:hypothetical protein ANCCEY_00557 [Ancylostoma ceylanicum]
MSQAAIAERYTIAKSNVCRILQRKKEYLMAYESAGYAGSRKRKLKATAAELTAVPVDSRQMGLLVPANTEDTGEQLGIEEVFLPVDRVTLHEALSL